MFGGVVAIIVKTDWGNLLFVSSSIALFVGIFITLVSRFLWKGVFKGTVLFKKEQAEVIEETGFFWKGDFKGINRFCLSDGMGEIIMRFHYLNSRVAIFNWGY